MDWKVILSILIFAACVVFYAWYEIAGIFRDIAKNKKKPLSWLTRLIINFFAIIFVLILLFVIAAIQEWLK